MDNAQEHDTEVATAEYLLKHGFPEGRPGTRKRDASGKEVIGYAKVKRITDEGTPPNPNAKPGESLVLEHDPNNNYAVLLDKSERPPREGDFYTKGYVIPRGPTIDLEWLTCPRTVK